MSEVENTVDSLVVGLLDLNIAPSIDDLDNSYKLHA